MFDKSCQLESKYSRFCYAVAERLPDRDQFVTKKTVMEIDGVNWYTKSPDGRTMNVFTALHIPDAIGDTTFREYADLVAKGMMASKADKLSGSFGVDAEK